MSGEKNDLFTSLSSFLKLCQLSSLCPHIVWTQLYLEAPQRAVSVETWENWGKYLVLPLLCQLLSKCEEKSCTLHDMHWLLWLSLDSHLLCGWKKLFLPTLCYCTQMTFLQLLELYSWCWRKHGHIVTAMRRRKQRNPSQALQNGLAGEDNPASTQGQGSLYSILASPQILKLIFPHAM